MFCKAGSVVSHQFTLQAGLCSHPAIWWLCLELHLSQVKWSEVKVAQSHRKDSLRPHGLQSMKFSRREYWSGYPFPSLGHLQPRNRTQVSRIAGWSSPAEPQRKPNIRWKWCLLNVPALSGTWFRDLVRSRNKVHSADLMEWRKGWGWRNGQKKKSDSSMFQCNTHWSCVTACILLGWPGHSLAFHG